MAHDWRVSFNAHVFPSAIGLVMARAKVELELPQAGSNFLAPFERVGLFIDGKHLLSVGAALEFQIDFRRLLKLLRDRARLIQASFYTVATDDNRSLIDWLDYNGFNVVTKAAGDSTYNGHAADFAINVELAVDVMQLANALDHIVLVSGKAEFRRLVALLQQNGKRVTVLSTMSTQPSMIKDELRRQADQFVDLADLKDALQR
jgi:uncharacterized LabA/DUF88 family protein